jgi:hypothetical protein
VSCGAALIVMGCIVLRGASAGAQEISDVPSTPPPSGPVTQPGLDQATKQPYWSGGRDRAFLATTIEGGFYYVRSTLATGYGRPHHRWVGVEGQVRVAESEGGEYLGARLAFPSFELRAGARYVFALARRFLPPQDSYDRDELNLHVEPRSRYIVAEAEATASLPLLGGRLYAVVSGHLLEGVPDEYLVFEESLRVIVDPPHLWRARIGQTIPLGKYEQVKIGVAGEVLGVPERDAFTVRVGPQLVVTLTDHLDAAASVMIVALSPDALGLRGCEFSQLGLRYRWATGELSPGFP